MFLRFYLLAVAWVLVGSAVGQIFLPEAIGERSTWGLAAGWQREIGFFDIWMAVVTFRAIRSNDLKFQRRAVAQRWLWLTRRSAIAKAHAG